MSTNIIFTCPACAGHELMQIQQAVHRIPVSLLLSENGDYVANPIGRVQELKGRILGYRCAHCRYPDGPNHEDADGFYWQSIGDITAAGALTSPDSPCILPPVSSIICQPDGSTRRISHSPSHPGPLSVAERAAILSAHHAPTGSVLLMHGE